MYVHAKYIMLTSNTKTNRSLLNVNYTTWYTCWMMLMLQNNNHMFFVLQSTILLSLLIGYH